MNAASVREPRVRKDGRCARKGCTRKLPRNTRAKKYAGDWLELDPFCSSRCCRAFHGVVISGDENSGLADIRSVGGRKAKARYQAARRAVA